jgi:hypothetical protein
MTTIRRLYLYLVSFVGMGVALAGASILIRLMVDWGFDAFRGFFIASSALALALLIAGGATWSFYWRMAQREATTAPEERASGTRKLYLYGTLTLSLLGALILLQQALADLFVRLLDQDIGGVDKPWTPFLIAAVLGVAWRWHKQIADAERADGAEGVRGGDLRRTYWFTLAVYGVAAAAGGLMAFISGLVWRLEDRVPQPFGFFGSTPWIHILVPPLMQVLVAGLAIWMFWLPSQKAAASGDEAERSSRLRSLLIHLFVFLAAVWALGGAQDVLGDVLERLLLGARGDLFSPSLAAPLASLIVGGLLIWYFFGQVRATLSSARPADTILAGVGLAVAGYGLQQAVAALLRVPGGQGAPIETLIPVVLPPLLIGGAVWRWRWMHLEAETRLDADPRSRSPERSEGAAEGTPGPAGSSDGGVSARNDLWRKAYLYVFQLAGLVMVLAGAVAILTRVIAALLGQPFVGSPAESVMTALSDPLSFLLVGGGLMIYMTRLAARDTRLGALSVEEAMQRIIGGAAPTWAIAAAAVVVLTPLLAIAAAALLGPTFGDLFRIITSFD